MGLFRAPEGGLLYPPLGWLLSLGLLALPPPMWPHTIAAWLQISSEHCWLPPSCKSSHHNANAGMFLAAVSLQLGPDFLIRGFSLGVTPLLQPAAVSLQLGPYLGGPEHGRFLPN
uniref:Uncharacterized protein n=1 Tax=Takifugu rubripes TaxID=31033 RepID=A0A674MXM0_TAKRU